MQSMTSDRRLVASPYGTPDTSSSSALACSGAVPPSPVRSRTAAQPIAAHIIFALGAFSGILAYGISFMSGVGGKLGWSWIFVSASQARIELSVAVFNLRVTDTGRSIHCGDRYHRALW